MLQGDRNRRFLFVDTIDFTSSVCRSNTLPSWACKLSNPGVLRVIAVSNFSGKCSQQEIWVSSKIKQAGEPWIPVTATFISSRHKSPDSLTTQVEGLTFQKSVCAKAAFPWNNPKINKANSVLPPNFLKAIWNSCKRSRNTIFSDERAITHSFMKMPVSCNE